MAGQGSRMSIYSTTSNGPRTAHQTSSQASTTTLLNGLHAAYTSGQSYTLEPGASLAINTWQTLQQDGHVVDSALATRAWEHARRRAEDGCIILGSTHDSTPSLLASFAANMPVELPEIFFTALSALRPFLHCVAADNPSRPRYSALAATLTLSLTGDLSGVSLALATDGIDTKNGLLDIPSKPGNRAFDVFYYLLASATPTERDTLDLKQPSDYSLLQRSGTYDPPDYLPAADDLASAEDFRASLKAIGIKGPSLRNLWSAVAAILKLGDALGFLVEEEILSNTCDEVAALLDMDADVLVKKCDTDERAILIGALYEAVVDWVIARANEAVLRTMRIGVTSSDSEESAINTPPSTQDGGDSVSLMLLEIPSPSLCRAVALRTVFDDTVGINAEMKDDGVPKGVVSSSVLRDMQTAVANHQSELGVIDDGERELVLDRRQGVLEKVGSEAQPDTFLRSLLYPIEENGIMLGKHARVVIANALASSRVWFQLCLHPTDAPASDTGPASFPWAAGSVSSQIRAWRLAEWANYRNKKLDYTADFDVEEFATRYARLGCQPGREGVQTWIMERGWSNGEVVLGTERVWIRESAWWEVESMLDMKPADALDMTGPGGTIFADQPTPNDAGSFIGGPFGDQNAMLSREYLMGGHVSAEARSLAPTQARTMRSQGPGDYGLGGKGDDKRNITYDGELDAEIGDAKVVQEESVTLSRRIWVAFVWGMTFWIPSFMLRVVGRMKRPDVRMAWREKLVLVMIIFLINGLVVFWIVEFGRLLCPGFDKAWNSREVARHTGDNDYWVSWRGGVYDMSKFWKTQHSDTSTLTTRQNMEPFAGTDVSGYLAPPLYVACAPLVGPDQKQLTLVPNNTLMYPDAEHISGPALQTNPNTALHDINWYKNTLIPAMRDYYKGDLVWDRGTIKSQGQNENHYWFILNDRVYDLTDYFNTLTIYNNYPTYSFFPDDVQKLVQSNAGLDLTQQWHDTLNSTTRANSLNCLDNMFYVGKPDFRASARCQVNNYILLAFTIIICAVILVKFLSALQLGSKRRPAAQDKFVICQVPAYTEGEDHLRKGLDSLTALAYDNKRKLICVICDGMIVGGGNDRPTPKIVLDILGVDPKIDPPALPFRSVGEGSDQLNYGKVYSGLYEYEGNVVPYLVVVKVGKESEQQKSKPGNRGKRDSQVLLMSFLNRVHHRSPMSPLELEMFHQINNIIGVDPELYEYLLMVDADTSVREDSLNRLVASCVNDNKIAGICGETSLENEERSWWTMIQVYEYYISHHLAKAFESLFGSVTCLPGCFCMYRLRTHDKGKPLIISDKVIQEYSDITVDTLHKKNLLSLGEDRYLTTLMTKHFPFMSYKFIPDAYALTAAPEKWGVLLSQRRRWINSTIHNLAELVLIKDLCGFCCFSMRFVVFIDLFGTIILPATCVYLAYLIYRVASHTGQFPLISIIVLAAVYGLQAIIFIIKRQWQHIGWMLIYIISYPVYSFILPVYSFWKQDDFSWGNTRVVLTEKGDKQVVAIKDEKFDPRSIPLQRWDDYAMANNLPGRRGGFVEEKEPVASPYHDGYEMDDIRSTYSSVHPASTILTGFPHNSTYHPPKSPSPFNGLNRQSTMSHMSRYTDMPGMTSTGDLHSPPGYSSGMSVAGDRMTQHSALEAMQRAKSPLALSRPVSAMSLGLQSMSQTGPSEAAITEAVQQCLREVDLDTVTKKQLKALTEQRLQCQLSGEKRSFLDSQIDFELANM